VGSGKQEFGKLVKPGMPLHLEDGFFLRFATSS